MLLMPIEITKIHCLLEKTIYFVFPMFLESLFTQSQVHSLLNSMFVSQYGLVICLFEVNIFVSSAKSTNF